MDAAISRVQTSRAAAAVCRDAQGNFMGSSALVLHGVTDVASLEAISCREGLSLAQDLSLQNFIIASDSKHVINDINRASHGGSGAIISEIKQRVLFVNCKFSFEGRATNGDADRLAKFSHSLDQGRHAWLAEPHDPFCIPFHVKFDQ